MKHRHIPGALLALGFFLAIIALTKTQPGSWNDISRFATIESLVERGTWAIDDSPWADLTKDKILLDGKFYSDKMPLFSFLGAGLYALLHYGLGMTLTPDCTLVTKSYAYYWLTLILVGVPVAWTLWLFFDFARRQNVPIWAACLGTSALGIGSMIFPYALVLNHHTPSASLLFTSFCILIVRTTNSRRWLALAGFLAALAISFDVLSGIIAASLLCIAVARHGARTIFFTLGALLPLGLTAWLDYQIAGTPIPLYMVTGGYNYPGSEFLPAIGGNIPPKDQVSYALGMFVGNRGLFAYNPLLLFALAGAIGTVLKRDHSLWMEAVCIVSGFFLLGFYLATNTDNYGGLAYGQRWFIPAIPVLFAFIFFAPPFKTAVWKNIGWLLFIPVYAISIISTLQGAQEPWLYWSPLLRVSNDAEPSEYYALARSQPIGQSRDIRFEPHASLVGYTLLPDGVWQGGQLVRVILYWRVDEIARQCYRIRVSIEDGRGHIWEEEERDPRSGSLPTKRWIREGIIGDLYVFDLPHTMPTDDYALRVSVYDSQMNRIIDGFSGDEKLQTEPTVAILHIVKSKSSLTATELQEQNQLERPYFVDMGDLRLLGFKPLVREAKRGEKLAIGLYWRARSKPANDYGILIQLRDSKGMAVLEHRDRPAGGTYPTTEWNVGEVLLDWHDVLVPSSVVPGEFTIWVGIFNYTNGQVSGEAPLPTPLIIGE